MRFHCSKWDSGWIGSVGHQYDESLDSQNDGGVLTEALEDPPCNASCERLSSLPALLSYGWPWKCLCSQAASLSAFPPHSCLDWPAGSFLFRLFPLPNFVICSCYSSWAPQNCFILEKKSSHTFISKLSHSHRTLSISFFFLESSWHYPLYFCPECFPSICFGWAISLFILLEEMKVTEVLVPWGEIIFIKWKKEGKGERL